MNSPFSVILAVMMFFMPESPYYLLLKGREEDARKALQWLRGKDYDIDQEMEEMKKTQEVVTIMSNHNILFDIQVISP